MNVTTRTTIILSCVLLLVLVASAEPIFFSTERSQQNIIQRIFNPQPRNFLQRIFNPRSGSNSDGNNGGILGFFGRIFNRQ
ncbi:hypothetical protein FHG87_003409 [Trinorchestia longiramus]|nr:hypothetical protein FHG87_003409 [Trinorchestia longiramus]